MEERAKLELTITLKDDGEDISLQSKHELSGDSSVFFALFCKAMIHQIRAGLTEKMELSKDFAQLGERVGECTCCEDDEGWIEDED